MVHWSKLLACNPKEASLMQLQKGGAIVVRSLRLLLFLCHGVLSPRGPCCDAQAHQARVTFELRSWVMEREQFDLTKL